MSKTEKFTISVVLLVLITSLSLYGVWEDKTTLYAPAVMLVYLALAAWAVDTLRRRKSDGRGQPSEEQISDLRSPVSGSIIPPGGLILLLFWFYSAIMIPFSVLPYEAKISTLRFGCYLGTYWATANILSRFPRRKFTWIALFAALVFVALYSLVQHRVAPNLIFGAERYTSYWENGRLGGTYQCPNHIAHLFQMWIPFCVVFLFIPQFGWFWRILFGYAIALFTLVIYQTQSRAGLLGTVIALTVTALLMMLRRSRRIFLVSLVALPLFGAGTIGALWAGSSMFRSRMQPVVEVVSAFFSGDIEEAISIDFRPKTWADSFVMFKDRPVTGFGPGNYELVFPEYRQRVFLNRMLTVHPHNEPIELLTEYGLIGALLIISALIRIAIFLVRSIKQTDRLYHALPAAALLGVFAGTVLHGFFDFELHIFPNAMMLALLSGCAVAPLLRRMPANRQSKSSQLIQRSYCLIIICAALWSFQVMGSAWVRALGDSAQERGRYITAEKRYKISAAIDPQNWKSYMGLGKIYGNRRYYELNSELKHEWALKERDAYETAHRLNVKKEEVTYGLGRVELFLGNQKRGLDLLRQAAQYKRFNDFYWTKLGIELRKAGMYQEALDAFEHAQKLNPASRTVKRNILWINQKMAGSG